MAQFVGLVSLGSRALEILPKVDEGGNQGSSRGILLRLLKLSGQLNVWDAGRVRHDLEKATLLEVFVSAYFDEVALLVRSGLLRRYQSREEELPVVRGRLMIERQLIARAGRFDRVACKYDDLTLDHALNRVLRSALELTRPWITSLELARRRVDLINAFADVSAVQFASQHISALILDRQAARYNSAMTWAVWIHRLLSPSLRYGHAEAPGLVFDMNQLFERSIARVLRSRARTTSHDVTIQHTGLHLGVLKSSQPTPIYGVRPDVVVTLDGSICAVADTKWTRVPVRGDGYLLPDAAHVYQMQAYASLYDCEEFTLIYPWHPGLAGAKATTIQLPANCERHSVLHVICIDVGSDAFTTYGSHDGVIGGLLGATPT